MTDITVVIPTIGPRADLLRRAVASVNSQTLAVKEIIVPVDHHREGAAANRQAGLNQVKTEWVAFLDDDDEFMAVHLKSLFDAAIDNDADYVFSWYQVIGGTDPRPEEFGVPWDRDNPRQTTITTLVRTEMARDVGGFVDEDEDANLQSPDRFYAGEDWRFTKRINEVGKIFHLPEKTWLWHHHGLNTSGLPHRW